LIPINTVKSYHYDGIVYNLEVDEDNSYLLAGGAAHNCIPILEAMACGVPVIATNCTAISELLADGRGLLVDYEYQHRDCFGNGWRYWFSKDDGVRKLNQVYEHGFDIEPARKYVEQRTWDIPAKQLNDAIVKLLEKK
jgi:glycosyltransferase involved in cell wall biosynthesis